MMNSTNFANGMKRVIRMGPRGGFYVSRQDGAKKRNPVARFRKAADGSMMKLTKANLPNVPEAIRPARAAAAKPEPKPRGRKAMSESARATKMFQDILNKPARKMRSNKGVARKPKAPKATPKPRGRKAMSESARATKMFQAILNKPVRKAAPKAAKVAAKNVIVVSPGGTLYKSKRSEMALKRAAAQKKLRKQNPFAALNKALMR